MAAKSKNKYDVYTWIVRSINKCQFNSQLKSCSVLINNFYNIYKDEFLKSELEKKVFNKSRGLSKIVYNWEINDNPKTYWIILKKNDNTWNDIKGNAIRFNENIKSIIGNFQLWKTRKWAKRIAKEFFKDHSDYYVFRAIVPVAKQYKLVNEKEIAATELIIKNDTYYET